MLQSLYIGATGMFAQQQNVDAIANNLANVNTTGFKKSRVLFSDTYSRAGSVGRLTLPQDGKANPIIGTGTVVTGNAKSFVPGELKQTGGPLDIAIQGNGFLEVQLPDGSSAYTRYGALSLNKEGLLANGDGYPLRQQIQIPAEATQTSIDATGKVFVKLPNEKNPVEAGQIELTSFQNPDALEAIGRNLYITSERTGQPLTAKPGEEGLGTIAQGYLESSNVQLSEEMVNLVLAQRAYELNAKVIQAADEMLAISNNLRR